MSYNDAAHYYVENTVKLASAGRLLFLQSLRGRVWLLLLDATGKIS